MDIADQLITENYALYNGDCVEVMQSLPNQCVDLSIYSPPFGGPRGGLYHYSSSEHDLSNCPTYEQFFEHYAFVVQEMARLTKPGRMSCVHCMDVPTGNSGKDSMIDFPGDIIRLHEKFGFRYAGRHAIWKEPLTVRNRTMTHALAHRTIVEDANWATVASADYLLLMRRDGDNAIPIARPTGLTEYHGERRPPNELLAYRGWEGKQTENRLSHWIWRQYASAFWDDIRLDRVLPFKPGKDQDDEKHVHPLQLDVIARCVELRSNPGETVLTPFMGVGSEAYAAVQAGRRGVGAELKPSYYRQAVRNIQSLAVGRQPGDHDDLFGS
jgi:DNA modification methylase